MAEILAEIYSWISFVPKITFKKFNRDRDYSNSGI